MRLRTLLLLLLITLQFKSNSQVINSNRGDSGSSTSNTPTNADISNGFVSGNVDVFTGCWNSSHTLGTISTTSGVSFTCVMSYSSSVQQGTTFKNLSGLPYGDNWNLNIPMITVKTEDFHRYTNDEMRNMNDDTSLPFVTPLFNVEENPPYSEDCSSVLKEGRLFWYAPMISIPGLGRERFVYKEFNSTDDYYLFLPHVFERFVQAKLYIPTNNDHPY